MKRIIYTPLLMFIFLFVGFAPAQAQVTLEEGQIINTASAPGELTASGEVLEKKIIVVSSQNNRKTLSIINPEIKKQLVESRAKRDEITALPGFISLAIEGNDIRITVDNSYIRKYLTAHFGFTEAELNNFSY